MGWVHRRRDLGGLIFIDLRDREGITQVVFNPQRGDEQLVEKASTLRSEYVVAITGTVETRPEGRTNPGLPTGEVELVGRALRILNTSKVPPISVNEENAVTR